MEIWLDTVNTEIIADAEACGILSGITTNPAILSQVKEENVWDALDRLLSIQQGPVAVQVTEKNHDKIIEEARLLFSYSDRLIIKIFANKEGFKAMKALRDSPIPILATGILHPAQALLAANLRVACIAPYFCHIEKIETFNSIIDVIHTGNFSTKILAAAVTTMDDLIACAKKGIDAITLKEPLYQEMISTGSIVDIFSNKFRTAWEKKFGPASFKQLKRVQTC